jgi:hypothetical protein
MIRNFERVVLAVAIACVVLLALPGAAYAERCSTKGVAGDWGFSYNGVAITSSGAVPINAVGRFTINTEGDVVGTEVRNLAGSPAEETLTGTLTVNTDCTATFRASI